MTTAIDELKTVLVLAGNRRLPHLEEEIFADEELTTLYLTNFCKDLWWYTQLGVSTLGQCPIESMAHIAFCYAYYELKAAWPVAEPLITTNLLATHWYAVDLLKTRWLPGEAILKTDTDYWRSYTRLFGITDD